jgi:Ca2+-binding RTX toxin-like protein
MLNDEYGATGSTLLGLAETGNPNFGHTYYVATNGSDTNSGSSAQPFLTIQHAANLVQPGDTVIVRDGVYSARSADELVVITRSGTADAPITFRAEHKWGAELDGNNNAIATAVKFEGCSYVRFEDFNVHDFGANSGGSCAFWIDASASHIYVGGNDIHDLGRLSTDTSNSSGGGVYAEGDFITLEGNRFYNIGRFGPGENGAAPGNDYWQNHDHGVYLDGVSHVDIINNTFLAHEHGWAIQVYGGTTTDLRIADNTFMGDNPNRPGQIVLSETIRNADISNNIFSQPLGAAITDYAPNFSNVSITNNTTTAGAVYDGPLPSGVTLSANTVSANPVLTEVNVPPAGSGTGSGANVPPPATVEYDHIVGNGGNNHLRGTAGQELLEGLGGRDFLEGGAGDDQLSGGIGRDKLVGGVGDDLLTGGAGRDLYVFAAGSGQDVITDFQSSDLVQIGRADAGAARFSQLDFSQTENGVLLTLQGGNTITFEGLSLDDLDRDNFMLIA